MLSCPECGNTVAAHQKFCTACGANILNAPVVAEQDVSFDGGELKRPDLESSQALEKDSKFKLLKFVLAIAVIFGVSAIFFSLWGPYFGSTECSKHRVRWNGKISQSVKLNCEGTYTFIATSDYVDGDGMGGVNLGSVAYLNGVPPTGIHRVGIKDGEAKLTIALLPNDVKHEASFQRDITFTFMLPIRAGPESSSSDLIKAQHVVVSTKPQPLTHFVDRNSSGSLDDGDRRVIDVPDGCYSFEAVGPDVMFDHLNQITALGDLVRLNGSDGDGHVFEAEGGEVTVSLDPSFGTGRIAGGGYEVVEITLNPRACSEMVG